MSQQHHLTHGIGDKLLKVLANAGLSEQGARIVINDETGKFAKGMVDSLGFIPNNQRPDLAEAKKIMGSNYFFGPSEWHNKYGPIFSLPVAPKIPWKKETLEKCAGTHFLSLSINVLIEKPVDILLLQSLHAGSDNPKVAYIRGENWYRSEKFATKQIEFGWSLVPLEVMGASPAISIPDEYLVATAVSRVLTNILFFHNNDEYLDQNAWALCSDRTDDDSAVYVRAFENTGICFYRPTGVTKCRFGYALTRKPDGL